MANDDELKKTVDTFDATDAKRGQAQRQTLDNTPEREARPAQETYQQLQEYTAQQQATQVQTQAQSPQVPTR
ncbi:hypothetical protein [Xanthomonas translucens]|uniref:Uncharacterized protein n=3 Tax=Xanthomonas campestris pv. translucens TaxID=343 RepID=A0A109HQC7_XANCT|nr:hypothetical protein [Xanthomonas translucens]AVY68429.1 hypothetical protein NZ30_19545 [Xanthomonas translucens pv. undulosa]KTF41344.1 hypothetical protein OZ12_02055 [Xanthomonas translucens pv. translucens]KWV12050.1 hypothetical protein ATB54_16635 [Xanthomonas translucens]KWV16381.1 hypothetical protein ATB53_09730 [Xanthomonas translucens]MCC8448643.1 hypothetical protein [Xanthomonas translucens pv. translucens]